MALVLARLLELLENIAPLRYAESWDKVGLLVDPNGNPALGVGRVLCTIDLTDAVLAEASERRVDLVLAYHPPLFKPLERLRQSVPEERVILQAVRAGLALYSPHTALDAAAGGVNDWLASAVGSGRVEPLSRITPDDPHVGLGRRVELAEPLAVDALVQRIKAHLQLPYVQLAQSERHASGEPVRSVAVSAGAGGSVLATATADLLLTGEMRHHDVRERVARGASVVLCGHSNTERGYLPILARRLEDLARGELEVRVARRDRDPLSTV